MHLVLPILEDTALFLLLRPSFPFVLDFRAEIELKASHVVPKVSITTDLHLQPHLTPAPFSKF